jgi:signal transduction histidine kinase
MVEVGTLAQTEGGVEVPRAGVPSGGAVAGEMTRALSPDSLLRIAHDVRSPLGLVTGALAQLREDLGPHLDEGHERMIALAQRGLARLERMACLLGTLAELERGSLRLQRETYDLARLVEEVARGVERDDPRRGVAIELAVPERLRVAVDLARMREALSELVAQGRRQAQRTLRISACELERGVELRIEDDGRGLDPRERRHAFERGVEPSDRRGVAFGLSIARDLVRAHGGEVTLADSSLAPERPGTLGTAFVVTLGLGTPALPRTPAR